jgi:hypothetical protein
MKALDNLVKVNQLKVEPADAKEFSGMLRSGDAKLKDSLINGLSKDSQFALAYAAAHSFSLAALRWYGYRSESRYLVFQCLQHTLDIDKAKWRVLDKCHLARSLSEYEGHLDVNPQLLKELISITKEIQTLVKTLPPIK